MAHFTPSLRLKFSADNPKLRSVCLRILTVCQVCPTFAGGLFIPELPYNVLYGDTWRATPIASLVVALAWYGAGPYAQLYRYRRVADTTARRQIKWALYGLLALVTPIAPLAPLSYTVYALTRPTLRTVFMVLLPVCLAIAVLRHRLFDIDVILERTLVYGGLTVSIVGLYVLLVGGLGGLAHGEENLVFSLLAVGLTAALSHPLRERLQRGVNRLLYGQRDEPYQVISKLGERLANLPSGLTLSFDAPPTLPTLLSAVETAAYYIALEALGNVYKHAGARSCRVRLGLSRTPLATSALSALDTPVLELDITDDGCGLIPEHRQSAGLVSMLECAAEVGGICVVESLREGGTCVSARLPCPLVP